MATYNGSTGNDTINGTSSADSVVGNAGSDRITTYGGDDTVYGGDGSDTVYGGNGNDRVDGGNQNDQLFGEAGNDTVYGGSGYDQVYGGENNDSLFGGDDTYDDIYGGSGNDTIYGGWSSEDWMWGEAGEDQIHGGEGGDEGFGGTENDTIWGDGGNDKLWGENDSDVLYGGAGVDTLYGGQGTDTLDGGDEGDQLTGGAGADSFSGGGGNDTIWGDTISVSPVASTGTANTTLTITNEADFAIDLYWVNTSGTPVLVSTIAPGGSYTGPSSSTHNFLLNESGTTTQLASFTGAEPGGAYTYSGNLADTIDGGDGDDQIYGDYGNDLISGGFGNDRIYAGTGDDTVYGGSGSDDVELGAGNDSFGDFNDQGDNDKVYGGTGNDTIITGSGDDLAFGGDGDDALSGGAGHDQLFGGLGNDAFWVTDDHNFDFIDGGEEIGDWDSIWFSNWMSTQGVSVTFTGTDAGTYDFAGTDGYGQFTGIEAIGGTSHGDTINAGADTDGAFIFGGDGNDSLTGGSGADYLHGGGGNDTIFGGAGADFIVPASGNDLIYAGAGADTIFADQTAGVLTIEGGEGADDNDVLALGDTRDPGGGVSVTLTGSESGTFQYSGANASGSYTEIEQLWLSDDADSASASTSTGAVNVAAGDGADTLTGSAYADTLSGEGGDDRISGGGGADQILGGAGSDTLTGGAGADTLTGGTGDDRFALTAGGGADRITDFDTADTDGDGFTNDQLDVSGLTDAAGGTIGRNDVTILDDGQGNAVLVFPNGETLVLEGISPEEASQPRQLYAMGIPCFAAGTRIRTPGGEMAVEDLRPGMLVSTAEGPLPVIWAGGRSVSRDELLQRPDLRPVLIRDGALGNRGDLRLSGQHAVALGDTLVRARHLAEARLSGVRVQEGCRAVTYHHILLPRHAIVRANGLPVETLYPGPMVARTLAPAAWREILGILPRLGRYPDDPVRGYGPRVLPLLTRRAALARIGAAPASPRHRASAERSDRISGNRRLLPAEVTSRLH